MGNRGDKRVKAHVDGVRIVTVKWAHKLGAHGMTGTLINSTEGIPTITCGGAAEPSTVRIKFDPDANGNALAPQLLYSEAKFNTCSGSFAASLHGVFSLQEITGSSVNGEFMYRVVSGALPNAGVTSPGTAVVYNESAKEACGLTGSFFAVFRGTSRPY